jgi:hypothetical protein
MLHDGGGYFRLLGFIVSLGGRRGACG